MIQFDLESINQNLSPTESLNKTNLRYGTMICGGDEATIN